MKAIKVALRWFWKLYYMTVMILKYLISMIVTVVLQTNCNVSPNMI